MTFIMQRSINNLLTSIQRPFVKLIPGSANRLNLRSILFPDISCEQGSHLFGFGIFVNQVFRFEVLFNKLSIKIPGAKRDCLHSPFTKLQGGLYPLDIVFVYSSAEPFDGVIAGSPISN